MSSGVTIERTKKEISHVSFFIIKHKIMDIIDITNAYECWI